MNQKRKNKRQPRHKDVERIEEDLYSLTEQPKTPIEEAFELEQLSDEGPLNDLQIAFVVEYMKDFRGKEAAIRAGYSAKSASAMASRLLKLGKIRAEIAKRQEIIARSSNITREYITEQLLQLIQSCLQDRRPDRASMLKAYDMINKMNGFYADINLTQNNFNLDSIKVKIVKPNE